MKRFEILKKRQLNDTINWYTIYAPLIAKHAKPGQFIILRVDEYGERIPLTMAGHDEKEGTIDIIVQTVGRTTMLLEQLQVGDCLADVVGPLGQPSNMEGLKRVCIVGGGVGNALAYPLAIGMHQHGIHVTMICGFKTKDIVILEDEFRAGVDEVHMVTDDGTYGEKGFTTDKLKQLLDDGNQYDEIVAVGPAIMMKFVCGIAKDYGIPSIASLATYMVDGTGMCGGCRCIVDGESKFVCVDGPDFDGAKIDWDLLIKRGKTFAEEEAHDRQHVCKLIGGVRQNA
ncbi:MAG: sulfide/dihydroorotate dehydrogenase-like FAD/NAD-binding protein [Clostridiales bacterium]|nr:sulfide/dihydroorotate dehydrogenase-like FAD/NAD-binding protein [Clostridiales bacterium]